jgi:hypothetical protein
VSTAGADAVEFAATCGLVLDEWQVWCLDQMLAERADGSWAASQSALIVPRQNGKNAVLEALELYALYVLDESRILHTAHLAKTAADHMARMVGLVRANPELDEITHPYFSNGKEALERLDTGARLEFITRGRKTARGGSPQRVVFDEALFLTDEQIQAILPAMSAQSMNLDGAPQFVYTSSAPLPESTVLHRVRQRGMSERPGRMFFAEWSCEPGVDITDRDEWYASNPGMGIRISEDWVAEIELPPSMTHEAFSVERLGVVVVEGQGRPPKLPADRWVATGISTQRALAEFPADLVFAFDVTTDGEWASIAAAAGSMQRPYVEVVEHRQGVGWLPARLSELAAKDLAVVVACHGAGPAGAQVGPILAKFAEVGIAADRLVQLPGARYRQACGGFYSDVVEGRLLRPAVGQGALDLAAGDATERVLGDAWEWNRRSATVPISPLVAVTIARALLPTGPTVAPSGYYTAAELENG